MPDIPLTHAIALVHSLSLVPGTFVFFAYILFTYCHGAAPAGMNDTEFEDWLDTYYSARFSVVVNDASNSPKQFHHGLVSPNKNHRRSSRHRRNSSFSFFPRISSLTWYELQYPQLVHYNSMSPHAKSENFQAETYLCSPGMPRACLSPYNNGCDLQMDPLYPQSTSTSLPLPGKCQSRLARYLRHTCFTVYRRLFSIVFLANLIASAVIAVKYGIRNVPYSIITTASSGNFFVAVLIRQDFFVNILYRTSWLVPWTAPLRLRRLAAKVYENGGVHSGAAVAGTLWFILLNIKITTKYIRAEIRLVPLLFVSWILQSMLLFILLFAYPAIRARTHNSFEYMHRFGGWLTIGLFWVESLMISELSRKSLGVPIAQVAVQQPGFWLLTATTILLILPWLRLRKWSFAAEKLSSHAMRLHYTQQLHYFSCLAISDSPLFEWHPFATFPAPNGEPGGSMVISDAGDWTHRLILNPSKQYWVKGVPRAGTLSMACIFQRVVIITTGSGIGPSLGYLLDRPKGQFCRLIWSTRTPVDTYGEALYDWIQEVDPDAFILDTNKTGRPDLVQLAYQTYIECNAEAIFVLSNNSVTRKVVYGMESRGIPAYGPIWDS